MRVKRFVAPTMAEAVTLVRMEFGADAMILKTGRARQPGVLGLFRPHWVAVTAAVDDGEVNRAMGSEAPVTGLVSNRAAVTSPPEPASVPQLKLTDLAVAHLVERLRQQEVAEEYVADLSAELRRRVGQGGEAPQQHLVRLLAERFSIAHPWNVADTPLIVPLVGPTGVGKTTTIAKLAATHALLMGQRVGLITADTYRVAAVEQLRTYADILDVPLEVVYDPKDVAVALERLEDRQLVLIDTAGRSPHNEGHLSELQAFLAEMGQHKAHLVLSATTRHADLVEIIDAFLACVRVEGLVVTKLDETRSYGCLYNVACRAQRPIAFVTTGQGVPEDMEAADPLHLASVIVGVEAW